MDGDSAPLEKSSRVTQQHDGWLMVDDAHGTGVIAGAWQLLAAKGKTRIAGGDVWQRIWRQRGSGALLNTVADYLLQFARHLIYSTSMPPAQAQAYVRRWRSFAVMRGCTARKLAALITRFRAGCRICRLRLLAHAAPSSH